MGGIQVGFGAEGGVLGNPGDFPSVPGRTPREGAGLGWMLSWGAEFVELRWINICTWLMMGLAGLLRPSPRGTGSPGCKDIQEPLGPASAPASGSPASPFSGSSHTGLLSVPRTSWSTSQNPFPQREALVFLQGSAEALLP